MCARRRMRLFNLDFSGSTLVNAIFGASALGAGLRGCLTDIGEESWLNRAILVLLVNTLDSPRVPVPIW